MTAVLMANTLVLFLLLLLQPAKQQGGLFTAEDSPLYDKSKVGYLVILERWTWLFVALELGLLIYLMVR